MWVYGSSRICLYEYYGDGLCMKNRNIPMVYWITKTIMSIVGKLIEVQCIRYEYCSCCCLLTLCVYVPIARFAMDSIVYQNKL